ncbi:MAG: 16S rRNA (adenine(1518)-N(6)/adenine(1519)-N(6))-dimethyltransferase RsmA [bacterium]
MKKTLKEYVRDYGGGPKRSLSQVFLIERGVLEKILGLAELGPEDTVIEIGPGPGALTREILPRVRRLLAIEIDRRLAGYLRAAIPGGSGFLLVCMDALRFDYRRVSARLGTPLKVIANLPYSVSSPLLFSLLDQHEAFSMLVLMLQKEVAQRLTASPGTKDYGALTVLSRMYFRTALEYRVSRHCFHPVPKVDSAVVRFLPNRDVRVLTRGQEATFRKIVKAAFAARRKTLYNSLRLALAPAPPDPVLLAMLRGCGLDPSCRAETLTLEEFVELALAADPLLTRP